MKVYVAAASAEIERARIVIAALRAAGVTVTSTWPEVVASVGGDANPRDASAEKRAGWASQVLAEVAAADLLLFLVPTVATRGAWWEGGFASARGKDIVSSGDTKQSIFTALGVEFATDAGAITHIIEVAKRPRYTDAAIPGKLLDAAYVHAVEATRVLTSGWRGLGGRVSPEIPSSLSEVVSRAIRDAYIAGATKAPR